MADEEFQIDDPALNGGGMPPAELPPEPPAGDLNDAPPAGEAPVPPVAPEAPAVPEAPAAAAPAATESATDAEVRDAEIPGIKDSGLTSVEGPQLATKRKLMAEPKVKMMIPLDAGEKPGAYRTVIINGYRFDVKKNTMVDLPQSVARLLADAYSITSDVLDNNPRNLASADNETRRALGV